MSKIVEIANTNLTLGGTYRTTFLADSASPVNNIPNRKWEYGVMALWTWTSVASGTVLSGWRIDSRTHVFEWTVEKLIDYDFLPTANVDKVVSIITFELNRVQKYKVKLAPLQTEIIAQGAAPSKGVLENVKEEIGEIGELVSNMITKLGEGLGNATTKISEGIKPLIIPLVIGAVVLGGIYLYSRRQT